MCFIPSSSMLFRVTFRPNSCSQASGSMRDLPKPNDRANVAFVVVTTIRAEADFERTEIGGFAMPRNCLAQDGSVSWSFLTCRTAVKVSGIVRTDVSTSAFHFELRYLSLVEKSLFNWKTVQTRKVFLGFFAARLVTIRTSLERTKASLPNDYLPGQMSRAVLQ